MEQTTDGWVELTVASGQIEAELIKGFLETGGVPVLLQAELNTAIFPGRVGLLGDVRVLVPEAEFEKARALLAAVDNVDNNEEPPDNPDETSS